MNKKEKKQTRAESGNMRFGDDWNGVFLRGDHAMHFGIQLQCLISDYEHLLKKIDPKDHPSSSSIFYSKGLMNLLQSSNQFAKNETQIMKDFEECFVELENEEDRKKVDKFKF